MGRALLFASIFLACTACGDPVEVGMFGDSGVAGAGTAGVGGAGGGAGAVGAAGEAGSVGAAGVGGAVGTGTGKVEIHFQSTTTAFTHTDGLSGQTPISHLSGVRSLRLFLDADDPNPVTVFELGQNTVEVSYADGADTLVYTAELKYVPKGKYTLARVVHTYVRYQIASTMHASGMNLPGTFDNVQVLSDGTLLDGKLRDHGYYEYVFETGGQTFPSSGTNAPIPQWTGIGGFKVLFENGEWAYQFPTNLEVDPNLDANLKLIFRVNMHESYRWLDQDEPGFAPGVFDTTPTTFEPVMQFGANAFEILYQ